MIYFIYLAVLLMLLFIERFNKRFLSKFCRVLIPVLFILLIGLRASTIGVDTHSYVDIYHIYAKWGDGFFEPGYELLQHWCYMISDNVNLLLLSVALITVSFFFLILRDKKGSYYTVTALCLYLLTYISLVNGIRQAVAVAAFLFSYKFIVSRNFIAYCLTILISSTFHTSVLLLLPFYFVTKVNLSNKWVIFIYISSFLFLFVDVSQYIPSISLGSGRGDYSSLIANARVESRSLLGFCVSSSVNVITLILMLKNQTFNGKYKSLSILVLIGFILKNVGFNFPLMSRTTLYFSWFPFLIFPYLLSKNNKFLFKSRQLTILLYIIIYSSIWINSIFSTENRIYPYQFFWEEKK